jgi:tetratricopeptide (TPR) repeat protein
MAVTIEDFERALALLKKESEANKFSLINLYEEIFSSLYQIIEGDTEVDSELLINAAKLATTARRWKDASFLWAKIIDDRIDDSNESRLQAGISYRMRGELDTAQRYFDRVTKTFRKRVRFQREYARLINSKDGDFLQAIEKKFSDAWNEGKFSKVRAFGSALAAVENYNASLVDHLPLISTALADLQNENRERINETPVAHIFQEKSTGSQDIFIGGFGWSGSGAVFDFLRQSSGVSQPFKDIELSIFDGISGKTESFSRFYQNYDSMDDLSLRKEVTAIVFDLILGIGADRPISGKGKNAKSRSLIKHFAKNSSSAQVFSKSLLAMLQTLCNSPRLDSALVESEFSLFFKHVFPSLWSAGHSKRIYNNSIHAKNCACLRLVSSSRMVAVVRDPRDQFVARAVERGGSKSGVLSVDSFIKFTSADKDFFDFSLERFGVQDRVVTVGFEEFVTERNCRENLCKEIQIDINSIKYDTSFKPSESAQNIGIYKNFPDQDAIRKIEDSLMRKA